MQKCKRLNQMQRKLSPLYPLTVFKLNQGHSCISTHFYDSGAGVKEPGAHGPRSFDFCFNTIRFIVKVNRLMKKI